ATGESIQLYQWTETTRTCVATAEPSQGLHNVVPVGSQLPLTSGSAARIIAAFADVTVNVVPVGSQLPLTSGSAARIIAAFADVTVDDATFTQADVDAAKKAGYSES